jgi:hypothetical protein
MEWLLRKYKKMIMIYRLAGVNHDCPSRATEPFIPGKASRVTGLQLTAIFHKKGPGTIQNLIYFNKLVELRGTPDPLPATQFHNLLPVFPAFKIILDNPCRLPASST